LVGHVTALALPGGAVKPAPTNVLRETDDSPFAAPFHPFHICPRNMNGGILAVFR
jgi:hypothetical protein